MATVTMKNLNKVFDGNVHAVADFNLHIKDKEFIVLVGPSGCGENDNLANGRRARRRYVG